MKTRLGSWALTLTVGLMLLSSRSVRAAYDTTNAARFKDWQDMGCRMSPGGAGALPGAAGSAGGNEMHCTACVGAGGRPAWWVDEPYINLWVADEPLGYTTSYGGRATFRFTYRQRFKLLEAYECPNYYWIDGVSRPRYVSDRYATEMRTYGMTNAAWGHNWLMDVVFWDSRWETNRNDPLWNHARYETGYEAWVMRPEGGIWYFMTNIDGQTVLGDAASQTRLEPLSALGYPTAVATPAGGGGLYWGEPATNGFRLVYADGSQDLLSLCLSPAGAGGTTARAFLTKRIDPQGRVTRVGYEYVTFRWGRWPENIYYAMRVRSVVDPDGRASTFLYKTNFAKHAWQVTEIADPYGRRTVLTYDDNSGVLTSITDAAGMTSWFTHLLPSGWLTNLTTPYGTTSFT